MSCKHKYFNGRNTMLRCLDCVLNLKFRIRYFDSIDINLK